MTSQILIRALGRVPALGLAAVPALLAACSGEPVEDRETPTFEESSASIPNPQTAPAAPSAQGESDGESEGESDMPAPAAAQQGLILVEGTVSTGTRCPVITTADGTRYALGGDRIYEDGDRLRIEAERARASICAEGEGTLVPLSVIDLDEQERTDAAAPAGRLRLTPAALSGRWTAPGGDCANPAFTITGGGGDTLAIATSIRGETSTGVVDLGPAPSFHLGNGLRTVAIEPRGARGLFLTPPAGSTLELGGEMVLGAGREFEKCPA